MACEIGRGAAILEQMLALLQPVKAAMDRCEDVANVLEGVVVKHG